MTDRELLEAAAKAAGYEVRRGTMQHQRDMLFVDVPHADGKVTGREWNPLTDDGDALRLAVMLGINFKFANRATWWDREESPGCVYWSHEAHGNDPCAATRRAIVRAAAEIGRTK